MANGSADVYSVVDLTFAFMANGRADVYSVVDLTFAFMAGALKAVLNATTSFVRLLTAIYTATNSQEHTFYRDT